MIKYYERKHDERKRDDRKRDKTKRDEKKRVEKWRSETANQIAPLSHVTYFRGFDWPIDKNQQDQQQQHQQQQSFSKDRIAMLARGQKYYYKSDQLQIDCKRLAFLKAKIDIILAMCQVYKKSGSGVYEEYTLNLK